MKQHITIQQFDELSDKNREKLLDWSMNRQFGRADRDSWEYWELTIGQMIEFLDDYSKDNDFESMSSIKRTFDKGNTWDVNICSSLENPLGTPSVRGYRQAELCDALWEAMKAILENPLTQPLPDSQ